jgi:hypothetical protein
MCMYVWFWQTLLIPSHWSNWLQPKHFTAKLGLQLSLLVLGYGVLPHSASPPFGLQLSLLVLSFGALPRGATPPSGLPVLMSHWDFPAFGNGYPHGSRKGSGQKIGRDLWCLFWRSRQTAAQIIRSLAVEHIPLLTANCILHLFF